MKYFLVTYEQRRGFGTASYKKLVEAEDYSEVSSQFRCYTRTKIKEITKEEFDRGFD